MSEKEALTRFGVSMPKYLVEQLDGMISKQGYENRSEALRDLVRKALLEPDLLVKSQSVAGTIVMVYDHHATDLPAILTEIQHDYHHEIISTMHIHLNHNQCLEIIVVRGLLDKIQQLHQTIQVQKGVVYAQLSVTHIDQDEDANHHNHHHHDYHHGHE
ncbi:nickel-responsive transcriptional regulator NikR [Paenibacillus planticolens]|nr:nickel-responsive transcriptional regulator NikR [Paenibacillus planticolens]